MARRELPPVVPEQEKAVEPVTYFDPRPGYRERSIAWNDDRPDVDDPFAEVQKAAPAAAEAGRVQRAIQREEWAEKSQHPEARRPPQAPPDDYRPFRTRPH